MAGLSWPLGIGNLEGVLQSSTPEGNECQTTQTEAKAMGTFAEANLNDGCLGSAAQCSPDWTALNGRQLEQGPFEFRHA